MRSYSPKKSPDLSKTNRFFECDLVKLFRNERISNINMYTGDKEYKMKLCLTFLYQETSKRFIHYCLHRFHILYQFFFYSYLIMIFFEEIIENHGYLYFIWLTLVWLIGIFLQYFEKYQRSLTRVYLLILNAVFCARIQTNYSSTISFLIYQIFEMASGHILVFKWHYYFLTSFANLIIHILDNSFKKAQGFGFFVIFNITYILLERILKENWVLFDSFKRSEANYLNLLNQLKRPLIVINDKSEILFLNQLGKSFIQKVSPN